MPWGWVGFGGGVLLAAAAWLAGALPGGDPAGFTPGYVIGLACWVAGGAALSTAWVRSASPNALRALWLLPLVFSPPLGSRDIYAYACQGWLWVHDLDPYRTSVAEGGCPWAGSVPQLWWDTPTPYGPLAIAFSGLAALTGSQIGAIVVLRALAIGAAVVIAYHLPKSVRQMVPGKAHVADVYALGTRGDEQRSQGPFGGRSKDRVWLGLLTPLVAIHGISGAHNDMLLAAAVVAALATGARHKPVTAGLWLAAAIAIKVTAIVAVPFVLILIGRRWWMTITTAAIGFVTLSLATGLDLGWLHALRHTGELVQWSSLPSAVGMAFGYAVGPQAIPVARVIGLIVLAGLAVYALYQARRGRVMVACGGLLAATALLGPVFYPWYAIAALAVLATTDVPKKWLIAGTLICAFLTLPNGHGIPALTKAVGAYAVTGILVALAFRYAHRRLKQEPEPGA